MEKEQRNRLQKATQDARRLLEEEFAGQLLQTYDINVASGRCNEEPGAHLQAEQRLIREKLVAWIEHRSAQINDEKEALLLTLREMAFTALNRFVALKLMEARELVRPCVSGGLESEGFQEFTAVAQGLLADQEGAYRLYLETIFEDVSRELRALFDPRDPASLLWPKRTALLELLDILNRPELAELWGEDETLGWVYQYFNGDAERKKMREESSAPRNSRELAVRNQFFTPRYVVEFLTDNTLGGIWYEMRQGQTGLKERCRYLVRRPNEIWLRPGEDAPPEVMADEALSQEELLQQPVPIPHRPLKDPREIRMLDPACGSMHFGLYAFDLYLEIYTEAWEIAQGSDEQAKQGEAFAPFIAFAADFANKADYLREVPRLILLHNIHGIDIDSRATQIARMTLWLRAQRAWKEQQLEVAGRPPITRSNVVCAEPMPGERQLLADFVDQQFPEAERGLVQQLLETIFDKMKLAGEAGSLLKIEEEISDAIDQARREWQKLAVQQQDLFSPIEIAELGQVGSSLNVDLMNLTRDFWLDIEERIYNALRDYAEQAQSGSGLQRRLFAEDAAQGFAFIDVCRRRYDVALMNPPFGDPPLRPNLELQAQYVAVKHDIASAFLERGLGLVNRNGLVGSITTRTLFFLSYLSQWRENVIIDSASVAIFADFGDGVLEATIETAAHVIHASSRLDRQCWFVRALNDASREKDLHKATATSSHGLMIDAVFLCDTSTFKAIDRSPFAYTVPDEVRIAFRKLPRFETNTRKGFIGALTQDDFRFVRNWWETCPADAGRGWTSKSSAAWVPYTKGGSYTPFYADFPLTINWANDGNELKCFLTEYRKARGFADQWTSQLNAYARYFLPGLTWSSRPNPQGSFWVMPSGVIFGNSGPAVQSSRDDLLWLLGILNSRTYRALLDLLMPRGATSGQSLKYEVGYVRAVPIPIGVSGKEQLVQVMAEECARQLIRLASTEETGHRFILPFLSKPSDKDNFNKHWRSEAHARSLIVDLVVENACQIDRISEEAYSLSPRALELLYKNTAATFLEQNKAKISFCDAIEELTLVSGYLSFSVGVTFGRWDIRYATGEQSPPELPDPFAPLPICPPGQLQNEHGLPAQSEDVPVEYPVSIPWNGILVDDPNHPLDLQFRIREVIEIILSGQEGGTTAESVAHEACEILGVNSLRDYFRKPTSFFADHLKRYSKSRRQAPIYWQLTAGSGSYCVWLYYHRFTADTLYQVLGIVKLRLEEAEREITDLGAQGTLSAEEADRIQEIQTLLKDLRLLNSELDLVAPLWNPNLNDGVIINHAILWRITPYTPWQKKCKECWDKLVKGDYDWAHLALHLWPERVITKCVTDRSLAIAHGLEERLWQETNKGNWLQRQVSEAELQALITEHSKPAVQNALERFLVAPPPVAAARTRTPRAAKSSSAGTTRKPRGFAPAVDAEASRQILLVLTAAPAEGLGRNDIASALDVEPSSITPVIKQLKEGGQIEQLGAARGAKYRLTEQGRAAVESQPGEEE
jgi:hypothetical protein